jgi:hypothetical protein
LHNHVELATGRFHHQGPTSSWPASTSPADYAVLYNVGTAIDRICEPPKG